MSAFDPGLRRVCVHAGTTAVDLALPAAVPVAALIPAIVGVLEGRGTDRPARAEAVRYRLSRPGLPPLPASTTLAQNGIRDGAVLVLSQCATEMPAPYCDDVAEAVSAALGAAVPPAGKQARRRAVRLTGAVAAGGITGIGCLLLVRNTLGTNAAGTTVAAATAGLVALLFATIAHRAYRDAIAGLTLSVVATAFAAVAGLLAVPGPPGAPHVLLAAMTAAVTSVLALRLTGCGVVTLTALSWFAVAVAVAALAGVITAAPLHVIGSVAALLFLGLLEAAARLSVGLAGLSPQPSSRLAGPDADVLAGKAIRADNWLTSLLAAFSASAALGAILTALAARTSGAARVGGIALAALTGTLLLLRARSHIDRTRMLMFVVTGFATAATAFALTVSGTRQGPWLVTVTASSVAAASYLGFAATPLSPIARRGVELLECLVLVVMVPLTCWICGLYGAVRGLDLL